MKNLKSYHLEFRQGPFGGAAKWESELKKINGVQRAGIDAEKMQIFLEYDAAKCSQDEINDWLEERGFVLDDNALERMC